MAKADAETATFSAVFRVGEFQALWTALVLSIAGDQLARVALSLLVFAKTDSAALAALTYALTILPDLAGGPLLSGLADRYPRRQVMVAADLSRAVLVALMALGGMPLVAVCVLLVIVQLFASPFNAARSAVLPSMLEGDLFVAGNAVVNITYQTGQLAGYVVGGALVAAIGAHGALAIDAGTFVASALLIQFGVRHRPIAAVARQATSLATDTLAGLRDGWRLVWHNQVLRALIGLACLCGFYIVGEGLAVPYAHQLGGGALTAGLVFAAFPAGNAIGMVALMRLASPENRLRLLGPMAVATCLVLVACLVWTTVTGALVLLVVAGAGAAYQTVAASAFMQAVPDAKRGQAFGLANASLRVAQGIGVVAAGLLADDLRPSTVVAIFGIVGTICAVVVALSYQRSRRTVVPTGETSVETAEA